jgi:hypothetical protein
MAVNTTNFSRLNFCSLKIVATAFEKRKQNDREPFGSDQPDVTLQ